MGAWKIAECDGIAEVFRARRAALSRRHHYMAGDKVCRAAPEDVAQGSKHAKRETFGGLGGETMDLRRRQMDTRSARSGTTPTVF